MEANISNTNKTYNFKNALKNVLKYKISVIMLFLSFFAILNTSTFFSSYVTLVAFVAFLILYFFSTIYKRYIPTSKDAATPGLSDYKQATKKC